MTPIIDAVCRWLTGCSALSGCRIGIDYLPDEPYTCAIENKGDRLTEQYADGSALRQYRFLVSVRLPYGDDTAINGGNAAMLEQVRRWIDRDISLPRLSGGYKAVRCGVLSEGYVYYADALTAKYQLEVGLDYFAA